MIETSGKPNSESAGASVKRRTVIAACAMIALSLAMFFVALFAPFQYYSDKDVLHTVYVDADDPEKGQIAVYQTMRVHQSLFKVFGAAGALGDAATLHEAAKGVITDYDKYKSAQRRLSELRARYRDIYDETVKEAHALGESTDSERFRKMFAKRLSDINLMALDMLETAFTSDNSGAYEAVYGGIVLAMLSALINIVIMIVAIVAIVFAVLSICSSAKNRNSLFYKLFTVIAAFDMALCLFNPIIPPAAAPLALACIAASFYYLIGFLRSFPNAPSRAAFIKNAVIGALVPVSMLCLAAVPSLTLYINGLGGRHLSYPGTIGTAAYSRIEAMLAIGLDISAGALTVAHIFGILYAIIAIAVSVKALDGLYTCSEKPYAFTSAVLFIGAACAISLIVGVYAITAKLQTAGELVKYIPGACWYVGAVLMTGCGVLGILKLGARKDTGGAVERTENNTDENNENAENTENAENGGSDYAAEDEGQEVKKSAAE